MGQQSAGNRHPSDKGPRYIFRIEKQADGGVIRVFDTRAGKIFREIPVRDFVAYAKEHRNVKAFLLGRR